MEPAARQRTIAPLSLPDRDRLGAALRAVAMPLDPVEARRAIARAAAELVAVRWGAVFLADERGFQRLAALYPEDGAHVVATEWPADGPVDRAAQTRQGQIAHANGAAPSFPGVRGTHTVLAVPLLRGGQLLGVLAAADDNPGRVFEREQLDFLSILATGAAVALENAHLREREREQRQENHDFVALVSHEFRTPLTSIKGYAQLAARRLGHSDDETVLRFLETINAQADRLASLASDMVLHARLESGEAEMRLRPTDLTVVLDTAVDCARGNAERRDILYAADVPELTLAVDPERLQQAVLNLLNNAIRRAPEGGEIIVGLRAEARRAVVWVRDQGPLLTPEEQEQALRRLYQRGGDNNSADGDALTLAIAKTIVEAHGGRLWFESEPGVGTTVYFALPFGTEGA